uniref:Probable helicase A859L n=1 Tax=viral metagenome TaxID=1070528 RepID=A0A6C0EHP3_9ZZZZ
MNFNRNLGYIYIIYNNDKKYIKIGSTFSYEKRYYQYKTYNYLEWKYIKVYEILRQTNDEYAFYDEDEDEDECENINCYDIDNEIQTEFSKYLTKKLLKECVNGGHEWYFNKDNNLINKIDSFLKGKYEVNEIDADKLQFTNFTIYNNWKNYNNRVLDNYIYKFNMEESEKKSKRKLRKYQKDYVKNCFNLLISSLLCLLVAPTGAGKTFMFYSIARKLLRKKKKDNDDKNATINIVILSPRLSINAQTVSENNINILSTKSDFIKINGTDYKESCDKYKDKIKDKNINFIISSTYHSAHKLQEFIETNKIEIDLIIFDECHFIKSWDINKDNNLDIKESLKTRTFIMEDKTYIKKRLFCSATPYKEQRENEKLYGEVVEEVKVGELIKAGYLAPIKTIIKDFKGKCSLSKLIIKEIIDKNKQKSVVFCNTQEHCEILYKQILINVKGTNIKPFLYISKYTHCIDIKDINTLKLYEKKDEISVIITCKKISMGYDFPMIDMVVFADAKCEKIDISQCIGRGLRTISDNPDKVCHILLPVNEEQLINSKYATIISYFDYIKYECDYDILSSKSWNTTIKPPRKPDDNSRVYKDEYGFDIECDFNDESLKTKISEKYSIELNKNNINKLNRIILTPENVLQYIGYNVIFNSRGKEIKKKILNVSKSNKSIIIDHTDLQNSLQIVSRKVYVEIPDTNKCIENIIKELIENNIASYSEYKKYQTKSKTTNLYSVEKLKEEEKFCWKLTDTKNKYYKTQKECEKEIKKIDNKFKKSNITTDMFIEYNKSNPKIPPMLPKDFYGIYCRNMKECFHNNQKVRHIINLKDSKKKEDIWEGIYNKEKNIISNNNIEYKGISPLNGFTKAHIKEVKPYRNNITVNAWSECEYYCNKNNKWITTEFMNPI